MNRRHALWLCSLLPLVCTGAAVAEEGPKKVRIVLIGDSTVSNGSGWGMAFARRVGPDAECLNLARSGRSSKSFRDEGHWNDALSRRPAYVLIQFGHNDQPGKGPERETDPKTTYREQMARYVEEARAIGAKPILVTSLTRRNFTPEGKIDSTLGPYVDAVKQLAADKNVPLVDLHALSIAQVEKLGPKGAEALDMASKDPAKPDRTHLSPKGGELTAALVIDELRKVEPELAKYLK